MSLSQKDARSRVAKSFDRSVRMLFERLPSSARATVRDKRDLLRGFSQLKRNQGILAKRIAELEIVLGRHTSAPVVSDPRFPAAVRSRVCTQSQFSQEWYREWCLALGREPQANRKLWEFAYIAHILDEVGKLQPGRRGLGFGVGHEPLVALFAGQGCTLVATDLSPDAEDARVWANTDQHARDADGLLFTSLCEPDAFRNLVSWRPVDMRSVPSDLTDFDFCWSACSLEHLGSIEAGLDFIKRSIATLAPGGIAVHTTEYNVWSNDDTVSHGSTVLYRRRDLESLVEQLEAAGH